VFVAARKCRGRGGVRYCKEMWGLGPQATWRHQAKKVAFLVKNVPITSDNSQLSEGYFPGPDEQYYRGVKPRLARRLMNSTSAPTTCHATIRPIAAHPILPSRSRLAVIPSGAITCHSGTRNGRLWAGIVTRSRINAAHTVANAISVPVEINSPIKLMGRNPATSIAQTTRK